MVVNPIIVIFWGLNNPVTLAQLGDEYGANDYSYAAVATAQLRYRYEDSMIRIVTDSTCDLPHDVIKKYNIAVVPAWVNIGPAAYSDGVDLQHDAFYSKLPNYDAPPTTAAPAPAIFTETYQALVDDGATEILSIHVSADLSSFLNSARLGAEAVEGDTTIELIDSRNVSLGLGLNVLTAAKEIERGTSSAAILKILRQYIPHTTVYCACDTLEYLRRSGRVGLATAGVGSLLKIKPILEVKEGHATSFDRVRTSKKIVPKLVSLLDEAGELYDLAVVHSGAPQLANELVAALRGRFPQGSLKLVTTIGPAIGSHIGPGAVGLALITKS